MPAAVFRNCKVVVTTSIVALMLSFGLAAPAIAHESISEQSPESGQTVTAGPTNIRLEFTGDLLVLTDASGIELQITDPSGNSFKLAELGCLTIGARSIEAILELDQPGQYQVQWQVTAGDGHPLSEQFGFEVTNPTGFSAAVPLAELRCDGNRLPDGTVVIAETTAASPQPQQPSNLLGVPTNIWLALLLGVALTLIATLTYLLLKPRKNRANSQ